MRKEKLKPGVQRDQRRSYPGTTRPENVSAKQRKQHAHNAPVRRAASKARG